MMVTIAAADGSIRLLNRHCEEITGYALADVVGHPIWQRLPAPEAAERMREAFGRLADGQAVDDDQGDWLTKDGTRLRVHWGYAGIAEEGGGLRAVVVTGVDLQASERMQNQLAESMDRYQAILDTAVDGIITIGERGTILSFNRAAERIFGYRAGEVIGRNVKVLMPEPYREEHDGYLDNYLRTRRKKIIGIGREVEGLRKDGTRFPLDLAVGEVVSAGQRLFTGIVRDITDRKEAERESRRRIDELAHVTRLHSMGDLAAGLSHEINQPLTAIISFARACQRMIEAGTADDELLRGSLEQIGRQGDRAVEIIRRLRKYVEKGEVEKLPCDLGSSVGEALALLDHDLQVNSVRVYVDTGRELPKVEMDRIQIEQVLVNLVRNAVEAMGVVEDAQRELHIGVAPGGERQAPSLQVRVRDTGPGFGATAPEQLFDPFFTTKSSGLGQGLSICRRIVEAHGGRIWAERAEPQGAVFCFSLPLSGR